MPCLHDVEITAVTYSKDVHRFYQHITDPWMLAQKMGLHVAVGEQDALVGRTIVLSPDTYSSRRRAREVIRHEIGHYLLRQSGAEGQIMRLCGSHEAALHLIERLSYHIALVLLIPDQDYRTAIEKHGHLPAAILAMCEVTGASLPEALRRWVYAEVGAQRGAFVVKKRIVVDAAAANYWMPFWKYDEVEDPTWHVPHAQVLALPDQFGRGQLGMAVW